MGKNRNLKVLYFIVTVLALTLVSCATQPMPGGPDCPGFLAGLLHGVLMPFTFIQSLFIDVRIYNFPNAGRAYDCGYLLGAAIILGGIGHRIARWF